MDLFNRDGKFYEQSIEESFNEQSWQLKFEVVGSWIMDYFSFLHFHFEAWG